MELFHIHPNRFTLTSRGSNPRPRQLTKGTIFNKK